MTRPGRSSVRGVLVLVAWSAAVSALAEGPVALAVDRAASIVIP
ncbi:MAG TPA: hypothetical protein VGK32_17435 [Vicinamibacterales bacterium]